MNWSKNSNLRGLKLVTDSWTLLPRCGCGRQFHVTGHIARLSTATTDTQSSCSGIARSLSQAKISKLLGSRDVLLKLFWRSTNDEDCGRSAQLREFSVAHERHVMLLTSRQNCKLSSSVVKKPVRSRYAHILSEKAWPEVVFMGKLQPDSQTSDMGTRPSTSIVYMLWTDESKSEL